MAKGIKYDNVKDYELPTSSSFNGRDFLYQTSYTEDFKDGLLVLEDSHALLKKIPDNSIQLVVSSPPYNIGKEYETKTSLESYIEDQENVITELHRILKHEGSICWEVGTFVDNGEVYPLDLYFYPIFKKLGMQLRNRIVWHFGHGLHCKNRFSGRHEVVLWFSKSEDYVFNLDSVRIKQKEPSKKHFQGDKKGKLSCNPKGKNPTDLWTFLSQESDLGIWEIPNVKSNHPEKTIHPAQYPIELAERCVLALSNEGDVVLDPYCGVGSSLCAGLLRNRRVIGIEYLKKYSDVAFQRCYDLMKGKLEYRKLGKPLYDPNNPNKKMPYFERKSEKITDFL